VSPGDTIHIVIPHSAPDTSVTATAAAAPTSTSTVTTNAPTPKEMREYYQKQEDETNNANAAAVTPNNNQTKGIGLNNVFNSLSVGITSGLTVVCDTGYNLSHSFTHAYLLTYSQYLLAKEFDQKYKLSDKN
jgi:flagellar basal body L-ring protein FlgH